MVEAVVLPVLLVKSRWPKTLAAAAPLAEPLAKNNTRLLLRSATYRLPLLSTATPWGKFMVVAVAPGLLWVKSGWPKTPVAKAPLAAPLGKSSTRLLNELAT